MSGLTYKLSAYEGPIDLLYQMILSNEIDICDIPVAELADQYLDFLSRADTKDMEYMSEFAFMAASLLEIKSRMILPKVEPEEDPRKELVDKLLEYKRMKSAAEFFVKLEEAGYENFFKEPEKELISKLKPVETIDDILKDITILQLYRIFKDVISKKELKVDKIRSSFKSVSKDLFTIEEKISYLRSLLDLQSELSFRSLMYKCEHKLEMIVTFLAVLEINKIKGISIFQNHAFGDIIIRKSDV